MRRWRHRYEIVRVISFNLRSGTVASTTRVQSATEFRQSFSCGHTRVLFHRGSCWATASSTAIESTVSQAKHKVCHNTVARHWHIRSLSVFRGMGG